MKVRLIILVVVFIALYDAEARFESNESLLAEKLLHNYNREMRPADATIKNKTLVKIGMTLSQIISVNEKTQALATSVYMTFAWKDNRFSWNEREYENISTVRMPPDYVWTPGIVLENNKDGSFDVSLRTNVLIYSQGCIEWIPPALYTSTCTIEISLFPFDWQNCSMVFRSATYDRTEMELGLYYGDEIVIDENAFQPNGEWDIMQKPIVIRNSTEDPLNQNVTVYLIIKRRPQFYVMNLIIPCILLSSLSCFVFYLPSVSCEKMTLSISILLGETVFLFLVAQRIPETSLAIPLIGKYLMFCITLVILSVICSVIVCNINYRSNITHVMPQWIVWLFMDTLAPLLGVERPVAEAAVADEADTHRRASSISARRALRDRRLRKAPSEAIFDSQAARMGFRQRHRQMTFGFTETNLHDKQDITDSLTIPSVQNVPKSLKSAVGSICYITKDLKMADKKSQSQDDWSYVALILDRALLWIYFTAFTLGTLGYFLQIATTHYPELIASPKKNGTC